MSDTNKNIPQKAYSPDDVIFETVAPGSDKARLVLFSAGTEDPNPVHLDDDFAKEAGYPTVLQQGPMTTAHFSRLLAEKVGQDNLISLDVRFTGPVFLDEDLTMTAIVTGVEDSVVTCALTAAKPDGSLTAKATAEFRI